MQFHTTPLSYVEEATDIQTAGSSPSIAPPFKAALGIVLTTIYLHYI